jgi:hypothetical protein
MQACHDNGDPLDNRLCNLRWDTRSANCFDVVRHGAHNFARLTEGQVCQIWRRIIAGDVLSEIAKDFAVTPSRISLIKAGTNWSHVTRHLPGWPLRSEVDPSAPCPVRPSPEFTDPTTELWSLIPDWPAYRVSTFGRIMTRWERMRGGTSGQHRMGETWRKKRLTPHRDGHLRFEASAGPGRRKIIFVHHAVLSAFAGPRPSGLICCHDDGNPANNFAGNLRWDTPSSNARDAVRHAREV